MNDSELVYHLWMIGWAMVALLGLVTNTFGILGVGAIMFAFGLLSGRKGGA